MREFLSVAVFIVIALAASNVSGRGQEPKKQSKAKSDSVSFKNDIVPIIKKNCLPCHSEDNFNPSELSLDDYDLMAKGGKNGPLWVPYKSDQSMMLKKLAEVPPFGDRMPLNSKRKIKEGKAKYLTDEDVRLISAWIEAGAKNN